VGDALPPTAAAFSFELEDRIQCLGSGRASYRRSPARMLPLDIPLEAAVNRAEVADFKEREAKRQRLKVGWRCVVVVCGYCSAGGGAGKCDVEEVRAAGLVHGGQLGAPPPPCHQPHHTHIAIR
jgi:hypothetical protein